MRTINRRKFLAELGKLLTFMYEEDRQTALAMYEKMFDDAEDEQALINYLLSPTRQAVILARVYDAKARKLEVHAQAGKDAAQVSGGKLPAFVTTINDIHEEALEENLISAPEVLEDQISIFSNESEAPAPAAVESTAATGQAPTEAEKPAAVPVVPAVSVPVVTPVVEDKTTPNTAAEPVEAQQPAVEEAAASAAASPVMEENTTPQETPADPVDNFLKDFNIDEAVSKSAPEEAVPVSNISQEAPVTVKAAAEAPAAKNNEPAQEFDSLDLSSIEPADSVLRKLPGAELQETVTVRKPIIPLLILYIILAIPVAALGIVILLVIAALFLALAVALGATGFSALSAAFGGFSVFADILVVVGISLIVIALAVLFLWIFIWFLGGAIVGLVSGIVNLCGKICYRDKEERIK